MKMFLGNTPMKNLNIHHYEISTNDCDMVASDLQAGKTAVARGQKITGTGKSFEFASYGDFKTNDSVYVPSSINVIQVSSTNEPIKLAMTLNDMRYNNFNTPVEIGSVFVNGAYYPISVVVTNNILTISCEQDIALEVFYGKDNYV